MMMGMKKLKFRCYRIPKKQFELKTYDVLYFIVF